MHPKIRPRDTLRGAKAAPKRAELDKLCRQIILKRDKVCRRCGGSSHLQVAHIYSRRFHSVRWTPSNLLLLCAKDHIWAHQHPIEAGEFFKSQLEPGVLARLTMDKNLGARPDRLTTKLILTRILKEMPE